jgi:hypothetical protein
VKTCAQLAEAMVTAGPHLRVLATSREPLGIPGEVIFAVSPLPVADTDEPWERVAASEAVRLFGARAATVRPGFQVTEANAGLIRDICHRLDGMPLALELAAAHVADALDLCLRIGHRAGIAASLEGLGEVLAAAGNDLGAAAFLGAAASRREAMGVPMPAKDRRALDTVSKRLRAKVGADELERAWQRGADMSLDDLLRQAPALETAEGERDGVAVGPQ